MDFVFIEDALVSLHLQKCDQSKTGLLEGKEIKHFYEILTDREEIGVIYKTYAKTERFMSAANLLDFLVNEQREEVDLTHAAQLIEKYEVDETGKRTAFFFFLLFPICAHTPRTLEMNPLLVRGSRG